jgi:hypothetical protein
MSSRGVCKSADYGALWASLNLNGYNFYKLLSVSPQGELYVSVNDLIYKLPGSGSWEKVSTVYDVNIYRRLAQLFWQGLITRESSYPRVILLSFTLATENCQAESDL